MPGSIAIRNFSKRFGDTLAVDDISLTIESGELFGLIGPDGAGKTTTMRTLCTLLDCQRGEIFVDGLDVRTDIAAIRALLGYMPQRFSLYPDLTVAQNLSFFAELFGVPHEAQQHRLVQLYAFSKLAPFKDRLASALSGGMKQKLALSCILIHTPGILVLDEPTTGVDPVSRREFWHILRQLRQQQVTILVSTPYMDEAGLCDRVAFMYDGRILARGKPDELPAHFPHTLYEVTGEQIRPLTAFFREQTHALSVQTFGDRLHVSFEAGQSQDQLARLKQQAPAPIASMKTIQPSIEDTFLDLMKSEGRVI
ncbi:MAG: ATP-binding cassette domain-containing protein [bacterium]